ncbi:hypothetical protein C8A03DRAFT_30413 [Achaetomium macrosporum]|uniref:GDP/GTP exchange factor Sec2 N-terminal domain-containing protein n=1 Tax=Achaetomium macrosporum TaxID=79813 RepID=A0AAN7CH03_9PEZI|nr:hypothetical protein C8A03DRAFT_30413 [Achaetomium macrosporum]
MTMAGPGTLTTAPAPTSCCPKCGFGVDMPPFEETQAALANAQKQIADLEAQVRLLNQKASDAVDRWADYEDELAKLRAQLESRPQTPTPPVNSTTKQQPTSLPTPPSSVAGLPTPSPSRASFLTTSAASRISALLSRKSAPNLKPLPSAAAASPQTTSQRTSPTGPGPSLIPSLPSSASYATTTTTTAAAAAANASPASPPPSVPTSSHLTTEDLLSALSREQALRQEAEARVHEASREVEELSASLFEQANEMVATERRARARLEARVGELERREAEKRKRLDRLERAVGRIERVRGVLGEISSLGFEAEQGRT